MKCISLNGWPAIQASGTKHISYLQQNYSMIIKQKLPYLNRRTTAVGAEKTALPSHVEERETGEKGLYKGYLR